MNIDIRKGPPSQSLLDQLRGRYRFRFAASMLAILIYAWMAPRTPEGFRFISGCGCAFLVYLAARTYYRLYVARQFDPVDTGRAVEITHWTSRCSVMAEYVLLVNRQGRLVTGLEYEVLRANHLRNCT